MKRSIATILTLTVCCVVGGSAFCAPAIGAPATRPAVPAKLELRIDTDGFDDSESDIKAVLQSAGRELLRPIPETKVPAIELSHGGPIVLYRRAKDGAVRMRLDTGDQAWAQYSFQFAHELCHILCGVKEQHASTLWLEESLCETASLFALRRMGERWATEPPFGSWKSFAPNLTKYAQNRINEHALPKGTTFAEWFRDNEAELSKTGTDRPRNTTVATALLPLFEAEPQHWATMRWLSPPDPMKPRPLADHLQAWHDRSPAEHRAFIGKLAGVFEIELKAVPEK